MEYSNQEDNLLIYLQENTDIFDLCYGPHLPSLKHIGAFKLTKVSGAYWKGKFGGDVRGFDATGVDHLFRSEDLANWDYIGPLFDDGFFQEPGEDCAVPNFWPIGNG